MDYRNFTGRPTSEICRDLIGLPFYYQAGGEKIGGYIVESEAYLAYTTGPPTPTGAEEAMLTRACGGPAGPSTSTPSGSTSFLTSPARKKATPKGS